MALEALKPWSDLKPTHRRDENIDQRRKFEKSEAAGCSCAILQIRPTLPSPLGLLFEDRSTTPTRAHKHPHDMPRDGGRR